MDGGQRQRAWLLLSLWCGYLRVPRGATAFVVSGLLQNQQRQQHQPHGLANRSCGKHSCRSINRIRCVCFGCLLFDFPGIHVDVAGYHHSHVRLFASTWSMRQPYTGFARLIQSRNEGPRLSCFPKVRRQTAKKRKETQQQKCLAVWFCRKTRVHRGAWPSAPVARAYVVAFFVCSFAVLTCPGAVPSGGQKLRERLVVVAVSAVSKACAVLSRNGAVWLVRSRQHQQRTRMFFTDGTRTKGKKY